MCLALTSLLLEKLVAENSQRFIVGTLIGIYPIFLSLLRELYLFGYQTSPELQ